MLDFFPHFPLWGLNSEKIFPRNDTRVSSMNRLIAYSFIKSSRRTFLFLTQNPDDLSLTDWLAWLGQILTPYPIGMNRVNRTVIGQALYSYSLKVGLFLAY